MKSVFLPLKITLLLFATILSLSFVLPTISSVYGQEALQIIYASVIREVMGPNSLSWLPGDRLSISTHVFPYDNTSVTAENNYTGDIYSLPYIGGVPPDEFGRKISYDPSLTGVWIITASDGIETVTAQTEPIGDVNQMPFLRNVKINGIGLTPTLSWTVPVNPDAGYVQLNIIDALTGLRIWWSPGLSIYDTEFTIPDEVLKYDNPYVIRAFYYNSVSTSRATSFFDFTPLDEGEASSVYIPTVSQDTDPTDEFGPPYLFDIDVEEGVPYYIDPFVAIGYDYEIGIEDTIRFASVTLPEIGDNVFDLYLFDDSKFYLAFKDLPAGEKFDFGPGGVDRFRVLGIANTEGIDPNDATAFITELTFTGDGAFTGSMTPIISYVAMQGDFEPDRDVDGSDLAHIVTGATGITLDIFASNYGRTEWY